MAMQTTEVELCCFNRRCNVYPLLLTSFCTGCRNAQYCSKKCQRADWSRHKLVCHRSLPARLKAVCEYQLTYGKKRDKKLSFFFNEITLKANGGYIDLLPFSNEDSCGVSCTVCGKKRKYDLPNKDLKFVFYVANLEIECYRCDDCQKEQRLLCGSTFMELGACRKQRILFMWLCLKASELLEMDVLRGILLPLINTVVLTCGHITQSKRERDQ